jgi:hypothetical protein
VLASLEATIPSPRQPPRHTSGGQSILTSDVASASPGFEAQARRDDEATQAVRVVEEEKRVARGVIAPQRVVLLDPLRRSSLRSTRLNATQTLELK